MTVAIQSKVISLNDERKMPRKKNGIKSIVVITIRLVKSPLENELRKN